MNVVVAQVTVEVELACDAWRLACADIEAITEEAARLAFMRAAPEGGADVILELSLTDDAEQQSLNREYRGKDAPTNVLAFPLDDPEAPPLAGALVLLGAITLARGTVAREAEMQGKPLADHVRHLAVHGVLHLLGYDHEDPAEAERMERAEIAILAELGVPDPYRDII